jgi:hypothetical protein
LIHASLSFDGVNRDAEWVEDATEVVVPQTLQVGAIIGAVDLVNVLAPGEPVPTAGRKWAQPNCLHWVFKNPRACTPVDVLGKLRVWDFDGKDLKW